MKKIHKILYLFSCIILCFLLPIYTFLNIKEIEKGDVLSVTDQQGNTVGEILSDQKISNLEGNLYDYDFYVPSTYGLGKSSTSIGDFNNDGIEDFLVSTVDHNIYMIFPNRDGSVKYSKLIIPTYSFDTVYGDQLGYSITNIGDLDGDGITDIAIGAYLDDDGTTDSGAVYIVFLNSDGSVKSYQKISNLEGNLSVSLDSSDYFGHSVSSTGDLNNDGIEDIAVGTPNDDDLGTNSGAIYVLFLNTDGTVKQTQKITSTQGSPAYLGRSLTYIGDLDNDGIKEFAVTSGTTSIYIISLNSDGTVYHEQQIFYEKYFTSLEGIGDLDNDGIEDLAAGCSIFSEDYVYIIFLNYDGSIKNSQEISNGVGGLTTTLDPDDYFGSSISSVGDLDNDGVQDIIVGSYGDEEGSDYSGTVYVLFLNSNGTVKSEKTINNAEESFIHGLDEYANLGISIDNMGDLDNDGNDDVVVGSYLGEIFILFLNSDNTVKDKLIITNPEDGEISAFGVSVSNIGDIDNNGVNDIAAGALYSSTYEEGSVYILLLNEDLTIKDFTRIGNGAGGLVSVLQPDDNFGISISSLGDLNNDGINDIVVGSSPYDEVGKVYILFLNSDGTVKEESILTNQTGDLSDILSSGDEFGYSVSSVGDIDKNGTIDIAIGSVQRVSFIFLFLNSDGTIKEAKELYVPSIYAYSYPFIHSIKNIGDLDDDGNEDFLLGTILEFNEEDDYSECKYSNVILFMLPNLRIKDVQEVSPIDVCVSSEEELDRFGYSIAILEDKNNDGMNEIAIGAPEDSDGNPTSGAIHIISLRSADFTEPEGSFTLGTSLTTIPTRSLSLSLSATDSRSGVSQMMICNNSSFTDCSWETFSTSKPWTLSSSDGLKSVYVKYKDNSGNQSETYRKQITLDTTGPTGSININSGNKYTTTTSVSLLLQSSDLISNVSQMMICNNSSFTGCSWESYSTNKTWSLTSSDGAKSVYIKYKDSTGNISSTYTDNIILDTTRPNGSISISSGESETNTASVTLSISAQDITSGVSQMMVCNNSSFLNCEWETYATTKVWSLTSGDGLKVVFVKFKNNAGLESASFYDTIYVSTDNDNDTVIPEDNSGTEENSIGDILELLKNNTEEIVGINEEYGVKISTSNTKIDTQNKSKVSVYKDSDVEIFIPAEVLIKDSTETISSAYAVLGESITELKLNDDNTFYGLLSSANLNGEQQINILSLFGDNSIGIKQININIDPYGYVYNIDEDNNQMRISGARVSLYLVTDGVEELYTQIPNQDNPQLTNQEGEYAFVVEPGTYILSAEADGYTKYISEEFQVDSTIIEKNIMLEKKKEKNDVLKYVTYVIIFASGCSVMLLFIMVLRKKTK